MEQHSENNPAQPGNSAEIAAASLGKTLREAREHLGLSVADVANQIKFAPRQIEALEADDFQHLPEAAFLRGFIRSYAKILQLDAQTLLSALPKTKESAIELVPDSVEVAFPDARSLLRQNMYLLGAAALLAVLAGGFAIWNLMSPVKQSKVKQVETPLALPAEVQIIPTADVSDDKVIAPPVQGTVKARATSAGAQSSVPATKTQATKSEPQIQAMKPASKPVSAAPAQSKPEPMSVTPAPVQATKPAAKTVTASPAPAAKPGAQPGDTTPITQLRLVFGEESWTEIKDRDGKIISSQVNPRGSELIVNGRAPFSMLIGHGLSVRLYHQGEPVDLTPYINKYSEVAHVTLK